MQDNQSDCGPMVCFHTLFYSMVYLEGLLISLPENDSNFQQKIQDLLLKQRTKCDNNIGNFFRKKMKACVEFRLYNKDSDVFEDDNKFIFC